MYDWQPSVAIAVAPVRSNSDPSMINIKSLSKSRASRMSEDVRAQQESGQRPPEEAASSLSSGEGPMQLDLGVPQATALVALTEAAANAAVQLPDPSSQLGEEQEDRGDVKTPEQLQ